MNPLPKGRIAALEGLLFFGTTRPGHSMSRLLFAALLCIFCPLNIKAQLTVAPNSPNGLPLSQRIVAYTINARLDVDKKSLDATEPLTYRHLTGQPLTTFPIHLYLSAFRPESTFTVETNAEGSVRGTVRGAYPK